MHSSLALLAILGLSASCQAHDDAHYLERLRRRHPHVTAAAVLEPRQARPSATRKPAAKPAVRAPASARQAAAPGTAGILGVGPPQLLTQIGSTTYAEATSALPTTYAAGASVPVPGASALPAGTINPADYPPLDRAPPVDSAPVKQWLAQVDMSQIPNIPVTQLGGCSNASNAQAVANAATNGWWTCGGHTRSTDVTVCPNKNTWGSSYDDGPSPYTPKLLDYLDSQSLKTTFFVVGSRAISRPAMLQYEIMDGHQLSVHTWSHTALTTQTNEQIVAELGWTKYAIKQITGLTPNTMRPPYGDIDDRVRAISLQMGLTPIIWTSANGRSFDTQDWQIGAGTVNTTTVLTNFQSILDGANALSTGFVVLEHDLYQQSVDLAVNFVLPYAQTKTPKITLQPIVQCLGKSIAEAYAETATNSTPSGVQAVTVAGSTGTIPVLGAAPPSNTGGSTTKSAAGHLVPALGFALALGAAGLLTTL